MVNMLNYVISRFDLAFGLSRVVDLLNPYLTDHHQRVAYIAGAIATEVGYDKGKVQEIIVASLLHDIGLVDSEEFKELTTFEEQFSGIHKHGVLGAYLLEGMDEFCIVSEHIKNHHVQWGTKEIDSKFDLEATEESNIVFLADRVDALIDRDVFILEQRNQIVSKIESKRDEYFSPRLVDIFLELSEKEFFWFNIIDSDKKNIIKREFYFEPIFLGIESLERLASIISRIIDFRCSFTATHSAGVAAAAEQMAILAGMDEESVRKMKIAGYLHDIGKLAVPSEIINKPKKLDTFEFYKVQKHTFYTYMVLNNFDILDDIKEWAAFHHEYLDGNGYPFHVSSERLDLGCRIMTVTDIFTAITEDRPYRKGMCFEDVKNVFDDLVKDNKIDGELVEILFDNFDQVSQARIEEQEKAAGLYLEYKEKFI